MASKSPNWLKPEQREALSRIPDDLTERELVRYYTLSDADRQIITSQTRRSTRLGFAVQLAVLRYPGFPLYALPEVPNNIIEYLAKQLQVNSSSYSGYQRGSTQSDHLEKIRQVYGYRSYNGWVMLSLTRQLVEYALESQHKLSLLEVAFQLIREQRIIAPVITTLERLIWNVQRIAEYLLYERLTRPLTTDHRNALRQLLLIPEIEASRTGLTWLKKPAGKLSSGSFQHLLVRIDFLERLHLPPLPLHVHPHRIRQLARRAEQYTPAALKILKDEREQFALLFAYLWDLHASYIDEVLDMFDRWLGDLFKRGQIQQQKHIQTHTRSLHRDVHRLARAMRAFLMAHDEDLDPFTTVFDAVNKSLLIESVMAVEQTARPANLDFRDLLEASYRKRRRTFLAWYSTLRFRPVKPEEPALEALDYVIALDQAGGKRVTALQHKLDKAWTSPPLEHLHRKRWRQHTLQNDRINPNFYEMAALERLRARLRSGDISVVGSRRYRDFESYLLTSEEWQTLQDTHQTRLALPEDAHAYLEQRQEQIEHMLDLISQELPHNEHLKLDEKGQLHLASLEKMEGIDPAPWQQRLDRMIPTMQLADLIIEVDQWTNFLSHFTHLNFGKPTTGKQKAILVAALMGLGMNIGLERMSLATDYSVAELAAAADLHIREETLQAGLVELDNFVLHQPFARAWGDGSTSSSDGLRVLVQSNTPQAVTNARYFGRQRGVTIITHVADIQMPFGRQCVISTDDREALYVIDNLCHHETDLNILEHYTDTAGYTYHVFALCAFIGVHFAPNIRSMTDQLLFAAKDITAPAPFGSLFRGAIESSLVIEHWNEMRRLVASIQHGKVSASLIMRKLAAYPRQNQLAKALREMGKLERTLFVLEYLYDEAFRRRIRTGLNKGELLYKLARALFLGQAGEFHDRQFQDQLHRASCLMLLIAAIVAWNTRYFQHAATWLEQRGTPIPIEVLPHLSPISWRHINFLGHYSFDLDKTPVLGTLRPLKVKPL